MTTEEKLTMSLGEAMFSQRAIRRFKPDPIPDEDLHAALEAATKAPSGSNLQPWRFIVIRDPELKEKFGKLYNEAWWAKRRDQGIFPKDIPPGKGTIQSARNLADEIGQAPVIVLVCATSQGAGSMASVIPAAQNLLLAARGQGIGGVLTTLHPEVDERVQQLLNMPAEAQVVYCVPLGYPRGRFGPTQRKPLTEVVAYDGWDLRVGCGREVPSPLAQ